MSSFYPLFAAVTHVLRLSAIHCSSVQVRIHVEQNEVTPDGIIASPTRTIFTRTSAPIHTDRITGFRCHAAREWLPVLKNSAARNSFKPSSTGSDGSSNNTPSWDVAMVNQCEGTMLVKDPRLPAQERRGTTTATTSQQQQLLQQKEDEIPITLRAQIIGEMDNGESRLLAESGSVEVSAARILFHRKVAGLLLHTPVGDIAVVVSVAREDTRGCQQRVEQFLMRNSALLPANAPSVAESLIRAANGDEIMVFCQLRKKFRAADFEGRLERFLQLYSLDMPENDELSDIDFRNQLLREWAPTEELLFVALATMFGPEQDTLSSWIRFRALNSVANIDQIPKSTQQRWRSSLRTVLTKGDAVVVARSSSAGGGTLAAAASDDADAAVQRHIHAFFVRLCEEIGDYQSKGSSSSSSSSIKDSDDDNIIKFREPPPFLYLYNSEVRAMLHIDSFGGMSQSVHPGDLDGGDINNNTTTSSSNKNNNNNNNASTAFGDQVDIRRVRNSANVIVDVVSLGVQTRKQEGETVASQCNFFQKPEVRDAMSYAVEYKLTSDEEVQTRDDVFHRTLEQQTDPVKGPAMADAAVDAPDPTPTISRDVQTEKNEVPTRSVHTSTLGDLPEIGFVPDIVAKEGARRTELEKALDAQMMARKKLEGELSRMDEAAETARLRLKDEVDARQRLEKDLETSRAEVTEQQVAMQRMTTQVRLADVERKDLAAKREETIKNIAALELQIVKVADEKAEVEKQVLALRDREEELLEQISAQKQDYESVRRQCDILSQDAQASRDSVEHHFGKMRKLEDELLRERTLHARSREEMETQAKHDLVYSVNDHESALEKIRRLESENEHLLRERERFLKSGAIVNVAILASEEAVAGDASNNIENSNNSSSHSPVNAANSIARSGKETQTEEMKREEAAMKQQPSLATASTSIEDGDIAGDPDFQSRVRAAKLRIQRMRDAKTTDEQQRNSTLVQQSSSSVLSSSSSPASPFTDVLPRLQRPRLPNASTAPILVVDDAHLHLTPSPGRHRAFRGEHRVNTPFGGYPGQAQQHFDASATPVPSVTLRQSGSVPLSSPPNRFGGAAAGAASPHLNNSNMNMSAATPPTSSSSTNPAAHAATHVLAATTPGAAAAAGAAAPDSSLPVGPRATIDEGWAQHRRGMIDSAKATWESIATGAAGWSTAQASQPMFIGARYEAEGLLAEMIFHDAGKAAEMYSAAIRYWPNQSVLLRLAGLHDREPNGDKDVAVDLYKLAAGMGSAAAKHRLAEMMMIHR